MGQLTEHGPRWAGTHESARSSPDTPPPKNHITAQPGAEARKAGGAWCSGRTGCDPTEGQSHGCGPDTASCAPSLAKDPGSMSESDWDSLTDLAATATTTAAAHLAESLPVDQPEARQASKFPLDASAGLDTKPGRRSTGEHQVEISGCAQVSEEVQENYCVEYCAMVAAVIMVISSVACYCKGKSLKNKA